MRYLMLVGWLALACAKSEPVPESKPVPAADSKTERAGLPACDSAGLDARFCRDTTYR